MKYAALIAVVGWHIVWFILGTENIIPRESRVAITCLVYMAAFWVYRWGDSRDEETP